MAKDPKNKTLKINKSQNYIEGLKDLSGGFANQIKKMS